MSDKMKNKVLLGIMMILFLGFSVFALGEKDHDISVSEKRRLQSFPQISTESLLSGRFMKEFDKYAVDQFPMRELFRRLNALTVMNIMHQKDKQGLYLFDDVASVMEYPMDENSLSHASAVFRKIYERYLKEQEVHLFFSIIPDKNCYLQDKYDILAMDYPLLVDTMKKETEYMTFIDIRSLLELDDYYDTDPHWKQEKIIDVALLLAEEMGASISGAFDEYVANNAFCGTYCGQSAGLISSEKLRYLSNDIIEKCIVYDYENNRKIPVYDMEKAKGRDPYEFFLSGSLSYITLENPYAETEKELVVFRDSFASSLSPLLVEGYAKITLIDIRYLQSDQLEKLIEFKNQDVLFIYSTSVLNHSETLK